MTVKLYDISAYDTSFAAKVISCEMTDNGYKVLLDQTLFFPEEGGQGCDNGTLNGENVYYVELSGDDIYHFTKSPFNAGDIVTGKIDFNNRYRNMQHHTGEHILSGLVYKLFGFQNVGFHLGKDDVTMDISGVLSKDEIKMLENKANEVVFSRKYVKGYYPEKEVLEKIPYRSKLDLTENVRIVEIEDTDFCACCAPHVKNTAEVGVIKITEYLNWKGGMRFFIKCGFDAYKEYEILKENAYNISGLLSTKQYEIADAVSKLKENFDELKLEKLKALNALALKSLETLNQNIFLFEFDDFDDLREAVNQGTKKHKIFVGLIKKDNGFKYIIGSNKINLKEIKDDINSSLKGKGGGTDKMISGTFNTSLEEITNYFKE